MTLIELNGGICNVKNTDLEAMYRQQQSFDLSEPKAKKVLRVLNFLFRAFPEKTPELKKYNAISLYIIASQLLETFVVKDRELEVGEWFISFETWRQQDDKRPVDERDSEMVSYLEKTSHATDSQDSLKSRHEVLLRRLHESIPDFIPRDSRRTFTEEQRLAIFRRDKSICQVRIKCDGKKCEWNSWHADHRKPWSAGGTTTVENGQVACSECNLAKSASIEIAI
jgi:5-methylcytosine-specific restriction endonuclease McrA